MFIPQKKLLSFESSFLNLLRFENYIFAFVVSTLTIEESPATVSIAAVSTVIESIEAESAVCSFALLELQAATDKDNAKAKNPNLNKFFILISFLFCD
jgi:hypothetical protein